MPLCLHNMALDYCDRLLVAPRTGQSVTDWIAAIAMAVTALIALSALWFAWRQVLEAKAARELMREIEVERAQPYVVVFTEESAATNLAIDLVIKNFGPTAAKNVRVEIDPWPERAARSDGGARVGIPLFPVLAPGQEWRTSWVWAPDRKGSGLPDRHEGTVLFQGLRDADLSSPIVLDLSIYATREWIEVRGIHDAAQALRDIRDNQKKWTEGLSGPLSVMVRDGAEKDARERERLAEMKRRRDEALRAQAQQQEALDQEPPFPDANIENSSDRESR